MQADLVKDVMNETFDYIHQINVNGNETGRITDTKGQNKVVQNQFFGSIV